MTNESHMRHDDSGSVATPVATAEPSVTPEQIDDWAAEIRDFFARTRRRLGGCGNGAAADPTNASPLERVMQETTPAAGMPLECDDSASSSDDALSRLHEIKQRLAARLQKP